jgi:transposase
VPEIRRKYDPEFREGAVTLVRETGKPIVEVAATWASAPARWQLGEEGPLGTRGEESARTRVDPGYVRQLELELAEVRMERDVLKRSVVLWVKEATR